jgi:hypothetical protein
MQLPMQLPTQPLTQSSAQPSVQLPTQPTQLPTQPPTQDNAQIVYVENVIDPEDNIAEPTDDEILEAIKALEINTKATPALRPWVPKPTYQTPFSTTGYTSFNYLDEADDHWFRREKENNIYNKNSNYGNHNSYNSYNNKTKLTKSYYLDSDDDLSDEVKDLFSDDEETNSKNVITVNKIYDSVKTMSTLVDDIHEKNIVIMEDTKEVCLENKELLIRVRAIEDNQAVLNQNIKNMSALLNNMYDVLHAIAVKFPDTEDEKRWHA